MWRLPGDCTGQRQPPPLSLATLRAAIADTRMYSWPQDIEFTLDRERTYNYKNKKRMAGVVASICDDLGIRHPEDHKAYLEVCYHSVLRCGASTKPQARAAHHMPLPAHPSDGACECHYHRAVT